MFVQKPADLHKEPKHPLAKIPPKSSFGGHTRAQRFLDVRECRGRVLGSLILMHLLIAT